MRISNGTAGLVCVLTLLMTIKPHAGETKEHIVWDVSNPADLKWEIVNDTVMGGRSTSRITVAEDFTQFSGTVSLENNGGFASVRTRPKNLELPSDLETFLIRVRGDGRSYKLTARRNGSFDGVNYQHEFTTVAGEWREVALPLKDFHASWRGRTLPDEPSLEASDIRSIGFIIADKQAAPFELEIDWIKLVP